MLITTIQLIDEYFDLKQRVSQQKKKLDDIAKKFQELKVLAIDYKEGKDKEINKLNDELERFKQTIEESNNLYETMLDKTTQSLEKIISNTESISKIQYMQKKERLRRKFYFVRKKKYFEIKSNFFNPLIRLIKKKNNKKIINLSIYHPSSFELNISRLFEINLKNNFKMFLPVINKNS